MWNLCHNLGLGLVTKSKTLQKKWAQEQSWDIKWKKHTLKWNAKPLGIKKSIPMILKMNLQLENWDFLKVQNV